MSDKIVKGNPKLLELTYEMFTQIRDGKYFDAIETHKRLTKILMTYKDAC